MATTAFPDGNAMIQQNTADFAKTANAIVSNPKSSPYDLADAKQWLLTHPNQPSTVIPTPASSSNTSDPSQMTYDQMGNATGVQAGDQPAQATTTGSKGLLNTFATWVPSLAFIVVGLIFIVLAFVMSGGADKIAGALPME